MGSRTNRGCGLVCAALCARCSPDARLRLVRKQISVGADPVCSGLLLALCQPPASTTHHKALTHIPPSQTQYNSYCWRTTKCQLTLQGSNLTPHPTPPHPFLPRRPSTTAKCQLTLQGSHLTPPPPPLPPLQTKYNSCCWRTTKCQQTLQSYFANTLNPPPLQTKYNGCCCPACLEAPRILRPPKTKGTYGNFSQYAEGSPVRLSELHLHIVYLVKGTYGNHS